MSALVKLSVGRKANWSLMMLESIARYNHNDLLRAIFSAICDNIGVTETDRKSLQ